MNSRHIACKLCRERKVRCPGQQPVCDRCRRAGEECVYLPVQRQSKGGSNLAETVEALQKRLEEAEALILSMNGHSGNTMAVPNSFACTGWPTTPDFTTLTAPGLTLPSGSTSSLGINQHGLVYQQPSEPQPSLVTTSQREAMSQDDFQAGPEMDFDIDLAFNQLAGSQPQPSPIPSPSTTTLPTSQCPSASTTSPQPQPLRPLPQPYSPPYQRTAPPSSAANPKSPASPRRWPTTWPGCATCPTTAPHRRRTPYSRRC